MLPWRHANSPKRGTLELKAIRLMPKFLPPRNGVEEGDE